MLHHIIYLSRATREMTPMELVAMLLQARDNNARLAITGALVYSDRQFMQVMEGEEAVLTDLYDCIARDPRHQAVLKLADKAITERTFVNWSMAFREVSPGEFTDLLGFVPAAEWAQLAFADESVDTLFLKRMQQLVVSQQQADTA